MWPLVSFTYNVHSKLYMFPFRDWINILLYGCTTCHLSTYLLMDSKVFPLCAIMINTAMNVSVQVLYGNMRLLPSFLYLPSLRLPACSYSIAPALFETKTFSLHWIAFAKSVVHICVCVCLNFLFYPIDSFICLYANAIQCWLLQLYKRLEIRQCKSSRFSKLC